MKTTIITIGNSKGLRLSQTLLKLSGIEKEIDISVKMGEIKIVPAKKTKKTNDFAVASEASFAKDWLRPEEEAAWKIYQTAK